MTEQEQELLKNILLWEHEKAPELAMLLVKGIDLEDRNWKGSFRLAKQFFPQAIEDCTNKTKTSPIPSDIFLNTSWSGMVYHLGGSLNDLALFYILYSLYPDSYQEIETLEVFNPEHAEDRILTTQREFNFHEILKCFRKGSVNGQMNYEELNKGFELLETYNDIELYDRLLEGCALDNYPCWPEKWIHEYKIAEDSGEFHRPAEIMNRLVLTAPDGTNIDSSFTEDNLLEFYLEHISECIGNTTSDDYWKIIEYWTPKSFFTNISFLKELTEMEIDGVKEWGPASSFYFHDDFLFSTDWFKCINLDCTSIAMKMQKLGLGDMLSDSMFNSFIDKNSNTSISDFIIISGFLPMDFPNRFEFDESKTNDIKIFSLINNSKQTWIDTILSVSVADCNEDYFFYPNKRYDDLLYVSFSQNIEKFLFPGSTQAYNRFRKDETNWDTSIGDELVYTRGFEEFSALGAKLTILYFDKLDLHNKKKSVGKSLYNFWDSFPECSLIDDAFEYTNHSHDMNETYKRFIQDTIKKHLTFTHKGYNLEVLNVFISHDFKVRTSIKLSTNLPRDDFETVTQDVYFGQFLYFDQHGAINLTSQQILDYVHLKNNVDKHITFVSGKGRLCLLALDNNQTNTSAINLLKEEYENILKDISELAKDRIGNFTKKAYLIPFDIIYPLSNSFQEKSASILKKISHSDFNCYDIDFSNYPKSMRQNPALMQRAIQIHSGNYIYASKDLQQNEEFILKTIDALSEEQPIQNSEGFLPFIEANSTITNQAKVELWQNRRQDKAYLLDNPHLIHFADSNLYLDDSFLCALLAKYFVVGFSWDYVEDLVSEGMNRDKAFAQVEKRVEIELKRCLDLDLEFIYFSMPQTIKEDGSLAHIIVDFHLNLENYLGNKVRRISRSYLNVYFTPELEYSLGIEVLNLLLFQYHYNDPELFKKICLMKDKCRFFKLPTLVSSLIRKISSMPESANFFLDKHVLKELILTFPNKFLSDLLDHSDNRVHDIIMDPDFYNAAANLSEDYMPYIQSEIKLSSQIEDDFFISKIKENGHELLFAPESIRGEIEVIKLAVDQEPNTFRYATPDFLSEKDNVIPFVTRFGFLLEFVSDELKNDYELVELAVKSNAQAIKFASERLKDNEAIAYEAVSQYGNALIHVSPRLKNNERIVNKAIERNGKAIKYASEEIRNNKNLLLKALVQDLNSLEYAPDVYKYEKKFILNDVPSVVSKKLFINNQSYMLIAIGFDASAFDWHIESILKSNRGFLYKVVKINSAVWSLLPVHIRKDKMFINSILEESSDSVFSNSEFMKDAISSNQATISKLGNCLKNNSSFMLELILENKEALNHIGAELRMDATFCVEVMKALSLKNIPDVFDSALNEKEEVKALIPMGGVLTTEYMGTVKFFSYFKGMGFIIEDKTKKEYYTDIQSIIDRLETGDKVKFKLKKTDQGMSAINVRLK